MATGKQLAANSANALKRSGARPLVGKERTGLNAVRLGLTAKHAVLPGDEQELKELRNAMFR